MAKRENFELNLLATDKASPKIDAVADKLDKLEQADATVELTAQDRATAEIDDLVRRLDRLDGEEAKAILAAESKKAQAEIDKINRLLVRYDGEEVDALLDAKDVAKAKIDALQTELDQLDRSTADATLDVTDNASGDINFVDGKLDEFDRTSVDATLNTDGTAGGEIAGIAGNLKAIGGKGAAGLAALAGTALAGLTGVNPEAVRSAQELAQYTGSSVEDASALLEVLGRTGTGIEKGDLMDAIGQMSSQLEANPGLIDELGISMDVLRLGPFATFVAAVDALANSNLSAADKMILGQKLFGEEGVRQINALITRLGPEGLAGAIVGVAEGNLITEDDVQMVNRFQERWAQVRARVDEVALAFQRKLLPVLNFALGPAEDTVANTLALLQEFGDKAGEALSDDAFRLEVFEGLAPLIAEIAGTTELAADEQQRWVDALSDGELTLGELSELMPEVEEGTEGVTAATKGSVDQTEQMANHTADLVAALDEEIAALEETAEGYQENIDRLTDLVDAKRSAVDSAYRYEDALDAVEDAASDYNRVLEETPDDARAVEEALEGVRDAAIGAADAHVQHARDQRAARGETLSLVEAIDAENGELVQQASNLSGPLRQKILDHIAVVNEIPTEVTSEIATLIDDGKLTEAERLLQQTSRRRQAAYDATVAESHLRTVDSKLDALTTKRYALVEAQPTNVVNTAKVLNDLALPRFAQIIARVVRGDKGRASGDPFTAGNSFLVGEQGPELVTLPSGSRVLTAGQTNSALGAGHPAAVNNYHIVNHWPVGTTARDVTASHRRYERVQGPV
jgi:hypothetical protein